MRDDIHALPMTAQAKRYARRGGLRAVLPGVGQKQFVKMAADLVNGGKTTGFASRADARSTSGQKLKEAAERVIDRLISL